MKSISLLLMAFVALGTFGCGGHGGLSNLANGTRTTKVVLNVKWPAKTRLIPLATSNLVVTLTGSQGAIASVTIPYGQVSTTIDNLPVGQISIAASAIDANGATLATGSQTVTTQLSATPQPVAIDMTSDITSLVVGPPNLLVTQGWTQQLTVSGLNAQGQMCLVTLSAISWKVQSESGNVLASNVPSGLITGKGVGTAVVQATDSESGSSGSLPVTCVLPGLANSPWPKVHHDAQNTGRGVGAAPLGNLVLLQASGSQYGATAIGLDGTLYASAYDGGSSTPASVMSAFDPQTGALKWQFVAGSAFGGAPTIGSDDTVYIGASNGKLYALQGQTGAVRWKFATRGIVSPPTIGPDGTIYVTSSDWYLYALNGADGSVKWRYYMNGVAQDCPALGPDGTVYFGCWDDYVYAIDGSSGAFKWRAQTGAVVNSAPVVAPNGFVYVGSNDGNLYAFDAQTGARQWTLTTVAAIDGSPALGADGTVFVGSAQSTFFALDGQTGAIKWRFDTGGGGFAGGPVIGSDGNVYVGADVGGITSLNGQTGAVIWQVPPPNSYPVLQMPAMGADGTLYFGSSDYLFSVH